MSDNKFLSELSQNLLEILNDEEYYDITIEVGSDPNVKIFRAHMVILNYRSSYLRRILSKNERKNDGTLSHIKLPTISPEIFQSILRYIYGGKFLFEEYDTLDGIIKILVAANELNLQELVKYLQTSLIENNSDWIEQNFNFIYQTSFENNSFLDLQKYCTDLISKEPDKIFKSLNFSSISEKVLISLIQSDELQMSEVQVWENVLNWGHAQNLELSSDPAKLSKDDFSILKNTLQHCIPFIRFYNLTSKEILDSVIPYREILPEELFVDLFKTFLSLLHPDSMPIAKLKPRKLKNVDSNIITFKHAEIISKWIDKLSTTDKLTSSYKFKLILRGSRDGFSPSKFHEICDGQSCTVSVIKVKNSNEILGGYNPIEWKHDERVYGVTNNSFIFSFESVDSVEKHILSCVKNEQHAIFNARNCGPLFGNHGYDLAIFGDNFYEKSYCRKNSYKKRIRKTENTFSVEEYEVFQIIKEMDG